MKSSLIWITFVQFLLRNCLSIILTGYWCGLEILHTFFICFASQLQIRSSSLTSQQVFDMSSTPHSLGVNNFKSLPEHLLHML